MTDGEAVADSRARSGEGGPRGWLSVYLKGVAMGAADTVPGVSGGTIALITGIYERLVSAIAAIDPAPLRHLVRIDDPGRRRALRGALDEMDLPFLVVLAAGVVTAVVAVSGTIAAGLVAYRALMNAFFFGLIGASAVVLYGEVSLDSPRRWAAAVAAAAFAFLVTGATAGGGIPHALPVLFLAGAVTSSAMLLPGISGAALLYVLGQYEFLIGALHSFLGALGALAGGGDTAAVVGPGTSVAVFLGGFGVGLLSIARIVRRALAADRATTLTVLVSLMVGALRLPLQEILTHTPAWTPLRLAATLLVAVVGGGAVLALDRYTDDLEY